MKPKRKWIALGALGLILCSLSFYAGVKWALRDMISYQPHGTRIIFRADNWNAGLYLPELEGALWKLRKADTNEATEWLESLMDLSIHGAMLRRPVLPPERQEQMDRWLIRIADYRQEFPRRIDEVDEHPEVVRVKREVDAFLEDYQRADPNVEP
jgi:hypothetical protein